jgi:N12 class adenine-specific DNA methylase
VTTSRPESVTTSRQFTHHNLVGLARVSTVLQDAQLQRDALTAAGCGRIFEEKDPARSERLVAVYNERFNSLRPRTYDGSEMELPGLGETFTPHPYQRDAAARIVAEPTVLLDHVVGAGKTGTMLMGAKELKRLGLVSQPWMVVPNHIIEQVGREAKQWYPAANVLVGTTGTDAEARRRLVAQTATSDWDLVLVPKSVFTGITVSPERQAAHLEAATAALRAARDSSSGTSFKRMQQAIQDQESRIAKLTEAGRKDTGLNFEESGCDYLLIDEAHMFKNKLRPSGVAELACTPGAQQAEDLVMKLAGLRDQRRDRDVAEGRRARSGWRRSPPAPRWRTRWGRCG